MKIIHIADISNEKLNGVNVVVPQHILHQAQIEDVRFFNYNGQKIDGLESYQLYCEDYSKFIPCLEKNGFLPDLVVFHGVNMLLNIKIYKQLVHNNIPYVIVPHGELTQTALRKKWLKKKVAYMLLFDKFIKNAHGVQCLSQTEKLKIKKKVAYKFVASNGVEKSNVVKKTFNSDCIKFVFIGRLEVKIKGLDLLIGAISKCKEVLKNNNVTFDIYGSDIKGRKAQVEKLIDKYGVNQFITIHSAVFGQEKLQAMLECDIFIQTSRTEGMPAGILEALELGMPCLLTQGTCLADLVESYNAGWGVETCINGIAEAIEKAIQERNLWEEKSNNARESISQNYLWKNIVIETIKEYRNIINA